jgi:hypothetical protein
MCMRVCEYVYIYMIIYIYNIVKDMLTHVYCIQLCQPTNAEDLFSQDLIPVPWWRQWTETPGAAEKARQVAASDVDERRWRPVASVSNHALHGSQSLAQCLVGQFLVKSEKLSNLRPFLLRNRPAAAFLATLWVGSFEKIWSWRAVYLKDHPTQ